MLGTTHVGESDPIEEIDDMFVAVKGEQGWDIPLHVRRCQWGFVAPVAEPDFTFDFRLEQVASINASGHKYGRVYPGVGWLINARPALPEDLIFSVNYLGGAQPTYTFNFCAAAGDDPGADVLILLRRSGFTGIVNDVLANARHLNESLEATGHVLILATPAWLSPVRDVHPRRRPRIRRLPPLVAATRSTAGSSRRTACRPTPRRCTCCVPSSGSTSAAR